jgi:hypothetical protein
MKAIATPRRPPKTSCIGVAMIYAVVEMLPIILNSLTAIMPIALQAVFVG